ncbi:protein kinase [Malikia sp.]|uniref:serine/threonine protein kinase n=1 Tax=Malikia sp. TaxID=2070706 RepID=UPI00261CB7A2|nr:protein kinase [Malikia sp.]MDD2730221.1 protein kinase [Malikia sp.]
MTDSDPEQTRVIGAQPVSTGGTRTVSSSSALPNGTRLSDEFEIVGLVGQGGFGIVYLAQDHSLQRRVAVKEYMPAALAMRGDNASVVLKSERDADTFRIGLRSFVNEARLLARFDHPALLKVYRFWEAHGTAYMAMPYYAGQTLKQIIETRGTAPAEDWIRKVLLPVMDALELLHSENCFHRDVAPDNIMLLADDRPVLLDFGAARRVIGDMTQALTVILKPGYAPIEQYAEMPGVKQGAWTDVYALAAVVYWMITGHTPPPAVGRMMSDSYEPLTQVAAGRYSERFLLGLDRCLSVKGEDRPQNMTAMRELLGFSGSTRQPTAVAPGESAAQGAAGPTSANATQTRTAATTSSDKPPDGARPDAAPARSPASRRTVYVVAGLLLAVTTAASVWWFTASPPDNTESQVTRTETAAMPASEAPAKTPVAEPVPAPITLSLTTPDGSHRYVQGQAISIRVRPAQPALVYCFMRDAKGQVQRFFPNRFRPSASLDATSLTLPGRMRFRINADFSGQPEAIACLASLRPLEGIALIEQGDFVPLEVNGLDELRQRLSASAGSDMGWASLNLLKR